MDNTANSTAPVKGKEYPALMLYGKKKRECLVDIETFSDVDLSKCGVYRYTESPLFRILLIAYAFDDGEIKMADLESGDPFPEELLDAFFDPDTVCVAHNASFERVCFSWYLRREYGDRYLKEGEFLAPHGWYCTMTEAAETGLPFSLDAVATVLRTGEQKDKKGKDLIRYFCVPCKPTKANGGRTRNLPSDAPDKWADFVSYCVQDVATERDIHISLRNLRTPEYELEFYWMNERINDRGWAIDEKLVEQAIICDKLHSEELSRRAYELSGLENPNSVSQLKEWLEERGLEIDSLSKKAVANAVKELDKGGCDETVLEMLLLRQKMAKSSVKKYEACERAVCMDGRAHGLFLFYGANHTGRFCLAEGTPVLIKDAEGNVQEKPIETVTLDDLVFDGDNWVRHEGVVFSGDKPVITWDGITATREHQVFIDANTKMPLGEAMEKGLKIWRGNSTEYMSREKNEEGKA